MNSVPQASAPRRHVWRWVALGFGLCLAPFVLLALVAASFLTLNRDAAFLRKQVMAATDAGWKTKVQLDVGGLTLGAVRTGLCFVQNKDLADAKLALAAVRHASVGVYERSGESSTWSRSQLFTETDRLMQKRGWTRLVGVVDKKDTVVVYVPQNLAADGPVEVCLAVVSGKELVVVSTAVDATALAELAAKHAGGKMLSHMQLAKLRL